MPQPETRGIAPIAIEPVAELLPQTEALKALLQQKREQVFLHVELENTGPLIRAGDVLLAERLQEQEEGERLQDQRLRALELRRQDELLRKSKMQRKMLRDAQERQRREEEGRSRQDPSFTSFLRLRRCAESRDGEIASHCRLSGGKNFPTHLSMGALSLNAIQIRILLREVLAETSEIEELDLGRANLTDDDGPGICSALRCLRNLKTLSLESNHLGASTAIALRKYLEASSTLESLDLCGCRLGGLQGIEELCRALRNNRTLKHLSLRDVQIDQAGGLLLVESLRNNSTLESLDICSNALTPEQHRLLGDIVGANRRRWNAMRDRETMERALMAREEADTKAFNMELEGLRMAVEGSESRSLAREAAMFAQWERRRHQEAEEHAEAVAALQQVCPSSRIAA
ncbi:hypothetical protein cyc_05508 [Cyclospora cayetanensis]|uniref:Uncharacterized protein n=1 Tax=Cyclospora cayetanensis TaxID=88456 RepID=A0A1D3D1P5_9EIME|nr:hypothetical protein cyc_05508 [Cyclospora cayetanensis]